MGNTHSTRGHTTPRKRKKHSTRGRTTSTTTAATEVAGTSTADENASEQSTSKAGEGVQHVDGGETRSLTVQLRVTCDGCGERHISGTLYKCKTCPDYDLCQRCKDQGTHTEHEMTTIHTSIRSHTTPIVDETGSEHGTQDGDTTVQLIDGHTSASSATEAAAAIAATSTVEENAPKAGGGVHHVDGHTTPIVDETGSEHGTQDGDTTVQLIDGHTSASSATEAAAAIAATSTVEENALKAGGGVHHVDESDQLAAIIQQYETTPPQMDADYGDHINERYARFLSVFGPPSMTLRHAGCETSSPTIHPGIICDGCARGIRGTLYKCKTCPNYDLCQRCNDQGYHAEHEMATIHAPIKVSERNRIAATIQQLMTPQMDADFGGGESLLEAATRGDVADVRRLLAGGVEVDWRDESGATAFWQAAMYGRLGVVRELAACHAQVDVKNCQGFSPLHCAAQEGHTTVVEELCRLGAQVDIAGLKGSVPLGLAAMKGHTEAVKALLKAGATVDCSAATGFTPLYVAASFGNTQSVKALLQAGAAIDLASYNGTTPLFVAAEKGHADTVSALLQAGATVDYCTNEGHTPMTIASDNDHANVVQAIVDHATTVDNEYGESLVTAARRGDVEDVRRLLATGVNVDWTNDNSEMPGMTAICWAAMYGHVDVVKELAASGADLDVNNEDHPPLHYAAQAGHLAVLEELCHLGADIHSSTSEGMSALHIAAQYGRIDVVNALLQHVMKRNECPPDTDVDNADGATPLHVAVHNSTIDPVNALQHAGADLDDPLDSDSTTCACIDEENEYGVTPLFYASCNGYVDVVNALLQNGAKVGSDCWKGFVTPLHMSACNGHTDVVNTLLQHGAAVDGCLIYGVTPLFLAVHNGHTDVVNALLQGGAMVDFTVGVTADALIMATRDVPMSELKSLWQGGAMMEYTRRIGATPLLVAAEQGHINIVSTLIRKNASVNLATENGQTPLSQAAFKGHAEIVHMLLTAGASQLVQHVRPIPLVEAVQRKDWPMIYTLLGLDKFNIQGSEEFTVLQWASVAEREDIVSYLLENDPDTKTSDDLGWSHLHQVAESGGAKAIRILIERGADIDATDGESRTPLHLAATKDHSEVAQVLVDNGADITIQNKNQETPLHVCARCDADSVADILLRKRDISIVETKKYMLRLCVQYDSLNVASHLIENNAELDPTSDEDKGHLLHFCIKLNRFAMAALLLKSGANVETRDDNGRTALHVCACNGNVNMAELLIKYGCDVNSLDHSNNTPLHLCLDHSISVSQCLLNHGANEAAINKYNETPLNVANKLRQTKLIYALVGLPEGWAMDATDEFDALQWASAADNARVVTLLLDNPITELSRRDKLGRNALDIAVQTKSFATAKALVGLDNTWNCTGMSHFTAIHWAAAANNALLLNDYISVANMDVNIQDSMGRTPLHVAAITDSLLTTDMLLKANACPTILSNDGDPPLFIAYYYNSRNVFSRLLSQRSDVAGRDGNTILHIAARLDDSKTIHQLLTVENEGLLELANDKGDSALHVAVVEDSVEAATVLLQRGADTRAVNAEKKKPLDLVGEKWKMLYLIQGADIDTTSVGILVEIHQRVADGDDTLTDNQLEDNISTRCSEGLNLLHVAVLNSRYAMVQRLLGMGADVNVSDNNGRSVLHLATRQSELKIMQLLLQTTSCHIDILDKLGRSPLHWAASENKFAFVECLLEAGASASLQADDYKTPVHILLENKIDNKVKYSANENSMLLLLKYLDNTLSPEKTADLAASAVSSLIMSENPEFKTDKIDHLLSNLRNCKRLFSSPCYLSNQTKGLLKDVSESWSRYTVFMALAEYYPPERLEEFLESVTKETINSTNFLKQNVLHLLTEKHLDGTESNAMVKKALMLIGKNLDVTQSDINSRTPLHLACQNQNHMLGVCLLKSLSKKGSLTSVNNKDIMGRTALHLLLRKGQDMIQNEECDDLIKHLFACGADPIVQDYNGESALECGFALRLESIITYSPSLLLCFPQITQIESTVGSTNTIQTRNELPKGLTEINVVNEHNIDNWISTLNESYTSSSAADFFLKSTEFGPLKKTYKNRANAERVGRFVQDLCSKALSGMHVEGHIVPGGSMAEGTKVGAVDEMDFLMRLTDMEELVNVVGIECRGGSPFARLSTKTTEMKSADEALTILQAFLQALHGLSSLPDYGISLEDIKRNKLKVFTLCLKCSQKSADDLQVTVDIVPSITKELDYHPSWNPTVKPKHGEYNDAREKSQNDGEAEMSLEREVENSKCYSQVEVSHLNFPLLMKRDGFEVSFLELEHQALQKMEPYKQNTYMLLKAMRTDDICPRLTSMKKETTIEDILPSYIFKMGLLWVLDPVGKKADYPDFTDDEYVFPSEEYNANEKIRRLALGVLKLLSARGRDTIPSYFCPSCKLRLTHNCKLLCRIMSGVLKGHPS